MVNNDRTTKVLKPNWLDKHCLLMAFVYVRRLLGAERDRIGGGQEDTCGDLTQRGVSTK